MARTIQSSKYPEGSRRERVAEHERARDGLLRGSGRMGQEEGLMLYLLGCLELSKISSSVIRLMKSQRLYICSGDASPFVITADMWLRN